MKPAEIFEVTFRNGGNIMYEYFDKIIESYEKQREETLGIYEEILEQYEVIYERFKKYE